MKGNRRAFTLLELVIAMAVTMVMLIMVISFSVMCNGWATLGTARYDLQRSQHTARFALENFVSFYDSNDYYLTNDDNKLQARLVADNSVVSEFEFVENTLQYMGGDGVEAVFPLEYITDVFLVMEINDYDDNRLVRLRLAYELPKSNSNAEYKGVYTIVVATRALGVEP